MGKDGQYGGGFEKIKKKNRNPNYSGQPRKKFSGNDRRRRGQERKGSF